MAQIDDSSVNPKMANFSNNHSSDTRPVKKKKKRYSRLHIVTYLCQFMGQNCEIWGIKKIRQRFSEAEPLDSKPHQTPPGCHTPPLKMVPPYSLGTCPPTTLKPLWRPVAPSSRKHWLSEDPWFRPKYSNGSGVAKNWHMSKWTSGGPRCLKLSWDQIWQKNVNGKCPKLPKRNCQSLWYKVV